jgi:hypothetical protein
MEWTSFWETFNAAIHTSNLTAVQTFDYLKEYSTHNKYWLTPCQFWCFNPREIGLTVSRAGIFKKY